MKMSSPNYMIWQYFEALRRLVGTSAETTDDAHRKQQVAMAILMAVTVVEAFLNVFFRVLVSEPGYQQHLPRIEQDLKSRKNLDGKIKEWSAKVLGKTIDWNSGIAKDFMALKNKRNQLMHFTSSHSSFTVGPISMQGAADISVFDELSSTDAKCALATAEGIVELLMRLRGIPDDQLPRAMQLWTGKVPA
jgi:hypothetical protein